MTSTAPAAHDGATGPALPRSRGELSRTVRRALTRPAGTPLPQRVTAVHADPYGDDLQLALHLCYELHYRGFAGVDSGWEWEPGLLQLRAEIEHRFCPRSAPTSDRRARPEKLSRTSSWNPSTPTYPPHSSGNEESSGSSVSTRPNAPSTT